MQTFAQGLAALFLFALGTYCCGAGVIGSWAAAGLSGRPSKSDLIPLVIGLTAGGILLFCAYYVSPFNVSVSVG